MPGLNASLSIGLSGLQASQAALNVVGHNIANVNTPSYSRQQAILSNNDSQTFGMLQYGQGVSLNNIMGVRDQFLEAQITQATSRKSGSDVRYSGMEGLSSAFMESGDSSDLSAQVQSFFQGFQTLAASPENSSARTALLGQAQSLVSGIQNRWQLLQDQRKQADGSISTLATDINTTTAEIAKLNARIAMEPTPGSDSDARDQRQVLANKLADMVGVQVSEDSKSQMQVSLDSGAALLVSGTTAYNLEMKADPLGGFDHVMVKMDSTTSIDITKGVKEGALGANLDLRDNILPGLQQKLDELASGIGGQVNLLHRTGLALDGSSGRDFFTGLAALNPATGLPGTVVGAANSMRVNTVLVTDPRLIAAAGPAALPGAVGDNKTALAIANLQQASSTVDTNNDGVGDSGPFGTLVSDMSTSFGTQAQGFQTRSTSDENLLVALQNQHNQVSGVDLDEEATQMMAFQRGYQASARFISVINQLTDQLVNQFGR